MADKEQFATSRGRRRIGTVVRSCNRDVVLPGRPLWLEPGPWKPRLPFAAGRHGVGRDMRTALPLPSEIPWAAEEHRAFLEAIK